MPRGRSKSIVQKIASDVPSYEEEVLNLGNNSKKDSPIGKNAEKTVTAKQLSRNALTNLMVSRRSKSFSYPSRETSSSDDQSCVLFPFSEKESEMLWLNHIETYNYNSVLDHDDLAVINEVPDDFILNFADNCAINIQNVNELIDDNKYILNTLDSLTIQYNKVSKDTVDFANQSTELLNQQQKYQQTIEDIDVLMKAFEPLDSITKSLSRPGNYFIKKQRFRDILVQLDESISFLDRHPDFKEYEFYKIRYRQCTTRALTLIRTYLIEDLRSLNNKITEALTKNQSDTSNSSLTMDIFLFNEFSDHIQEDDFNEYESFYQFPNLVGEIVKRIPNHDEYQGLLDDILLQYFKMRLTFLSPYIWDKINQQKNQKESPEELVQYCQNNISFFKNIIEKEFNLFSKFFKYLEYPQHQQVFLKNGLYDHFKSLIDPLYDDLRHKILRESNIVSLCELTILLQKYYEFEDDVSLSQSMVTANYSTYSSSYSLKINYGELFEPILRDVQSRIIFRIQIYVDDKLANYKPKVEDLKFGYRKRVSSSSNKGNGTTKDPLDSEFDQNLFPDLYLPLGKALTILSNIYELLNSIVFDDLAHYIVHSCIHILKTGAYKLALSYLGPLGAKLYYLKNLIILQNQLNNFDIQYVRTETTLDFTSGFNEIYQIFRKGEFSYNINEKGGLIELAKKSVPKVINNMIDAKYEIELELNNAVQEFITECANKIGEPILNEKSNLSDPLQNTLKFRDNLIIELPKIYKEIKLFIEDSIIIKFLMDGLSNLILSTYQKFYTTLENNHTNQTIQKNFEDIMEVDTLLNFINELVSGLYDEDDEKENTIEFNEDILNEVPENEAEVLPESISPNEQEPAQP